MKFNGPCLGVIDMDDKPKVLVVDDDTEIVDAVRMALEMHNL